VWRAALLALVCPVLFACSGGNGSPSDAPAGQSTSVGSSGRDASAPKARQLTVAELEDTLPTSTDMPAIFSPTKDDSSGDKNATFLCGTDLEFDRRNATAGVAYGAQAGLSAQQFVFHISQFDSPEVAVRQIRAFRAAADSCDKYAVHVDTYTVARASVGRIGDDAVAVRVTAKSAGFAVAVNVVVVRTGPSVVASLSATIGLAASTLDELVRLTEDTVDRYEAAARSS
jgi:hypothetical protein